MAKMKKNKGANGDLKSMTLTLRLLRQNFDVDDALRDSHGLNEIDSAVGRLFVGQSTPTDPTWSSFVSEFAEKKPLKLENMHSSAVLFLEINPGKKKDERIIALSFGGGHHSLNADAFERSFGLKVTLNSVARGDLRSLDTATLDSTSFQKRIQSSRKADLQGFGINVENDLLRLAGGVPTDTSFASAVAGRDALTMTTKTSATDILEKCKVALKLFDSKSYKKDFDFIDYIVPVRDYSEINRLNELVFSELKKLVENKDSDLHIALPEVINPEDAYDIAYFGVGMRPGVKKIYQEVAIEDYVEQLKAGNWDDVVDMATLKASHEIRVVVNGEGSKQKKARVYDCFVYEVQEKGKVNVLFAGEWYCVEKSFHDEVERAFLALVSAAPFVKKTRSKNEKELISEVDKSKDFLNLDQVKISPAGVANANLEPCDFFSRKKQFIHLKDGHSSAPISHLWNQAVVSAESFVRDQKFRSDLRREAIARQKAGKKTDFEKLLPDGRSKPNPEDYSVVFGIMRARNMRTKLLTLPFFSKVSLRPIAARLTLMGFPVELHLIEKV